ncbi:MAG: tRNA uridine-5-carboxymethylaminomethyl(34) synthesis enzyme MnmG, partial [Oscillospiraceae bacterium]|nr:tRNA uridine-5-carboxymethylaminomethyl(34) synthesis enzyme MnmG [Oscillospiraceae bacterium]
KKEAIENEIKRAKSTVIAPSDEVNSLLESVGSSPIKSGVHLCELVKRPELDYEILSPIDKNRPSLDKYVAEQAYIQLKYEGYIKKQIEQVEQFKKLENKKIPEDIDFSQIHGLRLEARQKLAKFKPHSIGQASRISGVSPSDINVLLIYLSR